MHSFKKLSECFELIAFFSCNVTAKILILHAYYLRLMIKSKSTEVYLLGKRFMKTKVWKNRSKIMISNDFKLHRAINFDF